MLNFIR